MKFKRSKDKTAIDLEIESVMDAMSNLNKTTNEYAELLGVLERLYETKRLEDDGKLSPDTKAIIAANLLGIVLILGYEQAGLVTSKALGFVLRGRV